MIARLLAALGLAAFAPALWADALTGDVQRQPLNVSAIVMFVAFVGATLCITYWASKRNRSAADYYAAGGRITGFQNGLAIAGDYMSAASFLGISALVFTSGYDGLIYRSASWSAGRSSSSSSPSACATWASTPSPTSPPTASSRSRSAPCRPAARWWWWRST